MGRWLTVEDESNPSLNKWRLSTQRGVGKVILTDVKSPRIVNEDGSILSFQKEKLKGSPVPKSHRKPKPIPEPNENLASMTRLSAAPLTHHLKMRFATLRTNDLRGRPYEKHETRGSG